MWIFADYWLLSVRKVGSGTFYYQQKNGDFRLVVLWINLLYLFFGGWGSVWNLHGGGGCTGFDVDIPLYVTSMSLGLPLFTCFIYHGEPIWRELPGWNGKV